MTLSRKTDMSHRRSFAIAVTIPTTARAFLMGLIKMLSREYDVFLLSNFSSDAADDFLEMVPEGRLQLVHVPFARKPSLWIDIYSWWLVFRHLRRMKPHIVQSLMPKTGLIVMTAALAARLPRRVHIFTGQVWATRRGWQRTALKAMDRLIALSATNVLADSLSQRDFLIANSIARRIEVLGDGSLTGVDIERFRPNADAARAVCDDLSISPDAIIFGFMGRLNRDKGVLDLVSAFASVRLVQPAILILVGPDEEGMAARIKEGWPELASRIRIVGSTDRPEDWFPAFDVCCLPSYREGFPTTILEAAACEVPALASRVYGLTDAVDEGRTGILHPPGDISAIAAGIERLAADPARRRALGQSARERVERKFSSGLLLDHWQTFYRLADSSHGK